jgi:hypothetical protein
MKGYKFLMERSYPLTRRHLAAPSPSGRGFARCIDEANELGPDPKGKVPLQ